MFSSKMSFPTDIFSKTININSVNCIWIIDCLTLIFYGVVVERQLFEPCENELQCNGTVNAGKCRSVANHSFCFCNDGLVEYQGRCIEGSFEFVSTINFSYISAIYLKYSKIILRTFFTPKCISIIKVIDLKHRLKKTKI